MKLTDVFRRYSNGITLFTDDHELIVASQKIKTKQYRRRFLKPNPYTMQKMIAREELPTDTYWTGYEQRPGAADLRPIILKRDRYTCRICERTFPPHKLHVDHIRPVWRYKRPVDATTRDNLWTLCKACHAKKTAADLQAKFDRQGESHMR